MITYNIIFIDANTGSYRIKKVENKLGPIDVGIELHLDYYKSYQSNVYDPSNIVFLGKGPFAGSSFFGSHRMVLVFRSPVSQTLHVSAIGGTAYRFMKTGIDGLVIEGCADEPALFLINASGNGTLDVTKEKIDETVLLDIFKGYGGLRGTKALTKYIIDRYWKIIKGNSSRAFIVGPAAVKTPFAGLCAPNFDYEKKKVTVEDWAARGGVGSILYQAHRVLGLIAGGQANVDLPRVDASKRVFAEYVANLDLNSSYIAALYKSTAKYRYENMYESGGTFGINYQVYAGKIPMFNWKNMMLNLETRMNLQRMIYENFLDIFNREAIATGNWTSCGEPCPVRCKKIRAGRHNDYEPYNAAGPMIGVFDLYQADRVIEEIDSSGFDAIEMGNVLGFLFECLEKGMLNIKELGLDRLPHFEPKSYVIDFSKENAELALSLIRTMIYGENNILNSVAFQGLRKGLKQLDIMFKDRTKKNGIKFEDLAVYVAFGEEGYMTPNFYWSPGFFAPMPILGKYWTYYANIFIDPEEYAVIAFSKALEEYVIENAGWCRFHRIWVEKALPRIYREVYNIDADLIGNAKKNYRKIFEYSAKASSLPRIWESERVTAIMKSAAIEYGTPKWKENINVWWERYWVKLQELIGINEAEKID